MQTRESQMSSFEASLIIKNYRGNSEKSKKTFKEMTEALIEDLKENNEEEKKEN